MSVYARLPRLPSDQLSRTRFRFALIKLSVLVGVLCVALPWATQRLHYLLDYREMKALGGSPGVDGSGAVYRLDFRIGNRPIPSSEDLRAVLELTELEFLDLINTTIDSSYLVELRGLPRLKWLRIPVTRVSIEAVEQLRVSNPQLKVVPEPLWEQKQLKEIQQLIRSGTLTVHQYQEYWKAERQYACVGLIGPTITDASLKNFAPLLQRVEHLDFDQTSVTLAALPAIGSLEQLESATFYNATFTHGEARRVNRGIPGVSFCVIKTNRNTSVFN